MFTRDVFVPNGDSRKDTAIVLVGTADEYGIDQRSIKTAPGGFHITSELADLVYDDEVYGDEPESEPEQIEPESEPEAEKKPAPKRTSGNRAAKNSTTEKE